MTDTYHHPNQRPRPADFEAVAATKNIVELQVHYRAGGKAVHRWLAEIGKPVLSKAGNARALPDNIAELCETHCIADIAQMISWSHKTLAIRLRTLHKDLYDKATAIGKKKCIRIAKNHTQKIQTKANVIPLAKLEPESVRQMAEFANQFLKHHGPCYAARIVKPGATGYYFRGVHFTAQGLIDEAKRRGWREVIWHGIAA